VKLDKQISLIDSPGVLFSIGKEDEDLVLRNCLKAEQLTDPVGVAYRIVGKCPQEQLCQAFKISTFSTPEEFLQLVAVKRGKIRKGGVPDTTMAAKSVILDWNAGKIPFHSVPPSIQDIQTSEIVSTWNQEFDVESVIPKSDEEAIQQFSASSSQNFTIMETSGPASMGMEEVEGKILTRGEKKKKETKKREVKEKKEDLPEETPMEEEDESTPPLLVSSKDPVVGDQEHPQRNQDIRKKQKKQKKQKQKQQRRKSIVSMDSEEGEGEGSGEEDSSVQDAPAYDFSDFGS